MTSVAPRNLSEEIGKSEPFELPEQEAYLNLRRTHALLAHQFNQLFKQHGISDPQYNALRIIAASGPNGIRSETIRARMVAQDPDTTRLVDRLGKAELVERFRAVDDRRCVLVRATAKGHELLSTLNQHVNALHRAQLGHLTKAQLKQLNTLLFSARHP